MSPLSIVICYYFFTNLFLKKLITNSPSKNPNGINKSIFNIVATLKPSSNNLISRIKARANADKNAEVKKSPDSLILRIKRRANADKNKDRER